MKNTQKEYNLYKGLQMPLVFKSFKGKYIYWALGLMVGTFVISAIVAVLFGFAVGLPLAVLILGGGLFYTNSKQKKGQFNKSVKKGVFIQKASTVKGLRNI